MAASSAIVIPQQFSLNKQSEITCFNWALGKDINQSCIVYWVRDARDIISVLSRGNNNNNVFTQGSFIGIDTVFPEDPAIILFPRL